MSISAPVSTEGSEGTRHVDEQSSAPRSSLVDLNDMQEFQQKTAGKTSPRADEQSGDLTLDLWANAFSTLEGTQDALKQGYVRLFSQLKEAGNNGAEPVADTAVQHLPTVALEDTGTTAVPKLEEGPKPRALNDETIKKYADELHSAVNRENWRGADDPDKGKIFQLLNSLGAADRKALEEAYLNAKGNKDHRTLRSELERRMDGDDWRKAEARLNTRDERSNDAGNLMVSLSAINDDRSDAERRVIETFAILNSEQRKNLYADFQKDYGMSVEEALKKFGVSNDGMKALDFINKPVEQRTSQEIQDFARFAVEKQSLDYLSVALRGDTDEAKKARQTLQNDQEFKKKLVDAFKAKEEGGLVGGLKKIGDFALGPIDEIVSGVVNGDLTLGKVLGGTHIGEAFTGLMAAVDAKEENLKLLMAMDILREGRPSLATIALNNTGSLFGWFDNKDNIKLAIDNATDGEKKAFLRGRDLVGKDQLQLSAEDKNNLAYYERLHKALDDAGDGRETALWEAKLLYGKDSLQAKIADTGSKNDRFSAIENMSQKDWEAFKADPNKRREFEQFLTRFVDEGDRRRMLEIVDSKTGKETFEQSQQVRRTVSELIKHNTDNGVFSTSYNGKNIVAGLETISPEEAQKYKNDPAYKAEIDKFVKEKLNNQERAYAEHMLAQVAETGKPPEQNAIGKILANAANGADNKTQLSAIEELLQSDPELRKRLSGDINSLNPTEKALRQTIDATLNKIIMDSPAYKSLMMHGGEGGNYSQTIEKERDKLSKSMWETGRLQVDVKADLGLKNQSFFAEAAKVSPEERERLFNSGKVSQKERQLIEKIAEQGGEMKLEDKMRSYILGDGSDPAAFKAELRTLTGEQKQQLKEAYARKYDGALEDQLLDKIDKKEQQTFKNLLTPSEVDGRQDYYDNLEEYLKSRSGGGLAPDGTAITVERAITDQAALHQWFNSRFEKMPPEIQEAANAYFKEALEQHKESKAKMAELLATIAITAAALAATPFTGGASLALVASIAFVAGGVAKVAIHRAVEGGDYDWNKALGHFVGGGTEGALNFLGGKIVEGMFKGFNVAGNALYGSMLSKGLVGEGGEAVTGRAFTKLIAQGKNVTDDSLDEFVRAVAPNADASTAAGIKSMAREAVTENYDAIINRATNVALSTVDNAAIGGGASAADVVVRATIDGRPITADEVLGAVLVGAGTGAVMGGLIRGGIEGRDIYINAKRAPNGEHLLMPSTTPDKPIVLEGPDGTRRTVTEPTTIRSGERIVDGPEPPGAVPFSLRSLLRGKPKGGPDVVSYDTAAANVNGVDVKFYENQLRLGQDFGTKEKGVSRTHATVNYDPTTGQFKLTDNNSSNGTWIKRKDSNKWEKIQGQETTVTVDDQIRLGGSNGPEVKLRAPERSTISTTNGGNPDVRLYLGDRPVDLDAQGNMVIGRAVKGADGQPIIKEELVSRDHGKLRYDKATDTYYYTDTSKNGTFVNGQRIESGKEIAIKPGDDVRLGSAEGTQLKLVSMKPETNFSSAQDAAVYVDGHEVAVGPDGRVIVGRSDGLAQDITDKRVSRQHGSLRFNEADKSFYYTDNSTNGTYILRGDRYELLPKGQEVKIKPDDDIRLGSVDGPRLELFNKNSGARAEITQTQVYFNGRLQSFDGYTGEIKVGRSHQSLGDNDVLNRLVSSNHGSLKMDPATGNMIYTDTSGNGTFIRRLDGSVEHVHRREVIVRPGEQIHLGSVDGPVLKLSQTPGRKLPDGSTLFRNPDGDLIVRKNGTSTLDDRAGIRISRDNTGNVTEATGIGRGQKYEYENGGLRKVTFADGTTYHSADGQTWTVKTPNQAETHWKGKMSVEPDGSLRFEDGQSPPLVRRLDGSEEVHWPSGHVEYRNANINVEAQRIEALIRHNFPDANQAERMRSLVRDINKRTDISVQEKADTLHQLNRLLTGGNDASLPLATRKRLSEQLAFNAAHPHLIDQGINKTCNVTTAEVRAYQKSPSDAIRMVTDVSLTGKYTTVSGKTVDVARLGTLTPDKESLSALQQPFKNGGLADLKSDGNRSFASQLFEQTAINVHYADNPLAARWFAQVQPGDIVAYKKFDVPSGTQDTGERIVIYRVDANGKYQVIPVGEAPNLTLADIEGVYNHVVPGRDAQGNLIPGQDRNFVWASNSYIGDSSGWRIQNEQQLVQNLLSAQQQGHMPIILTVNANHPLINGGKTRPGHAWHVVNVQSITIVNGKPKIEFTNQWGEKMNHLGSNSVNAGDLFKAMQ